MGNEELKRIYNLLSDIWRFYKKYADVSTEDSYWQSVVDECGTILKKYGNGKFVNDLLLAVIDELERKCQAGRGHEAV